MTALSPYQTRAVQDLRASVAKGSKVCNCCGVEKPAAEFHRMKSSADGLQKRCRSCHRTWQISNLERLRGYSRSHYARNPEKRNQQTKRWRESNPVAYRWGKFDCYLRREFGIDGEEWARLYESQGGKCCICLSTLKFDKSSHVDHSHKTGMIRGLLCHGCNTSIGHFRENQETLLRAISYLSGGDK